MCELGTCTHYDSLNNGCRQKECAGKNRVKDKDGNWICRKKGVVPIRKHHYDDPFLSTQLGII